MTARAALRTTSRENAENGPYDVRTNREPHSERTTCARRPLRSRRSTFLALKWGATRSDVVRSMIVGRALAQLDRLDDALDASEPSFDALVDVPSIDDVLAAPGPR